MTLRPGTLPSQSVAFVGVQYSVLSGEQHSHGERNSIIFE